MAVSLCDTELPSRGAASATGYAGHWVKTDALSRLHFWIEPQALAVFLVAFHHISTRDCAPGGLLKIRGRHDVLRINFTR